MDYYKRELNTYANHRRINKTMMVLLLCSTISFFNVNNAHASESASLPSSISNTGIPINTHTYINELDTILSNYDSAAWGNEPFIVDNIELYSSRFRPLTEVEEAASQQVKDIAYSLITLHEDFKYLPISSVELSEILECWKIIVVPNVGYKPSWGEAYAFTNKIEKFLVLPDYNVFTYNKERYINAFTHELGHVILDSYNEGVTELFAHVFGAEKTLDKSFLDLNEYDPTITRFAYDYATLFFVPIYPINKADFWESVLNDNIITPINISFLDGFFERNDVIFSFAEFVHLYHYTWVLYSEPQYQSGFVRGEYSDHAVDPITITYLFDIAVGNEREQEHKLESIKVLRGFIDLHKEYLSENPGVAYELNKLFPQINVDENSSGINAYIVIIIITVLLLIILAFFCFRHRFRFIAKGGVSRALNKKKNRKKYL